MSRENFGQRGLKIDSVMRCVPYNSLANFEATARAGANRYNGACYIGSENIRIFDMRCRIILKL
jgi:hypothetical protein